VAVELCTAREAFITSVIVLLDLEVREDLGEGYVAAVYHGIFQYIGVAALTWDGVGWEILNLVQCTQTVQQDTMYRSLQTLADFVDSP
jgi:hypothetical protein